MARRYDSRTTIFSPEGRLFQVEYAMGAINHAGTAVGVLATEGVVLAAEKKVTSKLLEQTGVADKMYKIDDHIATAVAGITADANILINNARVSAQKYRFQYQEPSPVEGLVQSLCDLKQGYTQFGGLRPFGVSFLVAGMLCLFTHRVMFEGWDKHYGFQLYKSDPSGNYGGWKATSIGAGHQDASSTLKAEYKEGETSLKEALILAAKVLSKTMDSTQLGPEKLEFATLTRENGKVVFHLFSPEEITALLEETKPAITKPQ